jgi:hypothetical protein
VNFISFYFVGTSHSHTDNQTPSFGRSHTDGQTPSITVKQTSKLLGQQTPCSGRRQFLYTAARGQPIQVLANQRPQLQLRLQLVRTQPSSNGIKTRTSSRLAALTALLSMREHHISRSVNQSASVDQTDQHHQHQ